MKNRKVLCLVLTAVMLLGMLAGCASSGTTETTTTQETTAAEAAAAETQTEESGSITLGIWPEDSETEAIALHTDTYVPAFNAEHPNVEVVPAYYKYSPDTYVAMATAGNSPTVFESLVHRAREAHPQRPCPRHHRHSGRARLARFHEPRHPRAALR